MYKQTDPLMVYRGGREKAAEMKLNSSELLHEIDLVPTTVHTPAKSVWPFKTSKTKPIPQDGWTEEWILS